MSYKEKYILLNTYYDKLEIERRIQVLKNNKISFKINDKSNLSNYRIPQSTYIEVDIFIKVSDYENAFNLLKESLF